MRDFLKLMRQYASPYKGHLAGAVVLNILSAVFNIFSFAVLVPLLNILFKVDETVYEFIPWDSQMSLKDKIIGNFYFYVSDFAGTYGAVNTLMMLAGVMILFTALKTSCYFGSNAVMIPISTGIVKEIRCRIYDKILNLPIGFFTEERKGDIIARITGDVALDAHQRPYPHRHLLRLPHLGKPGNDDFHHPLRPGFHLGDGRYRQTAQTLFPGSPGPLE